MALVDRLTRSRALTYVRRGALGALVVGLAASISLSEVSLSVLAVWLVIVLAVPPLREAVWRPRAPLIVPFAGFAAWTVASALASPWPRDSVHSAKSLLTLVTLYVVLHALPDARAAHRFATALFAAVAVVSLLSIVQVLTCSPTPPHVPVVGHYFLKCARAHGFFSIYMTLAGVLTPVLLATLPRVGRNARTMLVLGPPWLLGAVALAFTSVRGAWLGFAAGVLVTLIIARRQAVVVGMVVVAVLVTMLAWPAAVHRARSIVDPHDETARDRLAMLHGGLVMAREHPITGVGIGQVKRLYPRYAPPEALRHSTSHLHDTPLQILVERGVIGLALWLAMFAAFFVRAGRTLARLGRRPATDAPTSADDRALVVGVIAAITAFLVAGLFEYNFGDTEVLLVACALMALALVIERDLDARADASVVTEEPRTV